MRKLIEARNISRSFKNRVIFSGLNIDIYEHDVLFILGKNGAGKTQLLNILTGMEKPNSGEVIVHDSNAKNPWDIIGSLEQESRRVNSIKGKYLVDLLRTEHLKNYPNDETYFNDLFEMLDIDQVLEVKIKSLSGGQKQKLSIFQTLLRKPKILVLDELSNNLDFISRKSIFKFLKEYHAKYQATLIFISHDKEEILELATRIIYLKNGKIELDTPDVNYVVNDYFKI